MSGLIYLSNPVGESRLIGSDSVTCILLFTMPSCKYLHVNKLITRLHHLLMGPHTMLMDSYTLLMGMQYLLMDRVGQTVWVNIVWKCRIDSEPESIRMNFDQFTQSGG